MAHAEARKTIYSREELLNVHRLSSFFLHKQENQGYDKANLVKWTKELNIFSKDMILIPVNRQNQHWTAAAINFRRRQIELYDSMGTPRPNIFKMGHVFQALDTGTGGAGAQH
ncbi:uncharacterized protein B0H18DRAFT_1124818 [Fomitopsis serialis]|uniref:uncharacterized protein n=1 Tax=Fomitopsis serialis TaxID=139415 RepID=UPI002008D384|nr:uncharacterized protein B0H18DRAFT_1124818 [Neoantrodia serialis]KAH9915610.1 hypothetical protein B0H18DRAFT_1124818 [Neoantrodia serialis]